MKLVFFVLALLSQRPSKSLGQHTTSVSHSESRIQICKLSHSNSKAVLNISYSKTSFKCLDCKRYRTLLVRTQVTTVKAKAWKDICRQKCSGVLCGKSHCVTANSTWKSVDTKICLTTKRGPPNTKGEPPPDGVSDISGSQIPLIIGFAVGGILLAIVVAGIFLTRHHRTEEDGSEAATSPISLSNNEWQSNGGSGSSRRREENLRVQEASAEDLTALPLCEIREHKIGCRTDENGNECIIKEMNDASSVGQDSYGTSEIPSYYHSHPFGQSYSNRSSDVILEDDYITQPSFFDHKFRDASGQKITASPGINNTEEQNFFNGQTAGSMTQDAICMSLTHSANNRGDVEYVIQDEDFVAFGTPASSRVSQTSNDNTMQLTLHLNDVDSDFENQESLPNSAVKSDKSDVFFPSEKESLGSRIEPSEHMSEQNTPRSSEFSIQGNCKDSRVKSTSNGGVQKPDLISSSVSWNENCKGRSSERFHDKAPEKRNRIFAKGTNRSKSCTWKSPNAPTHSSTRKQSGPHHCPSSAPSHFRPRLSNLTHVFVDVHRNMASSDEDLLSRNPSKRHCNRNPSFSDSDSSSCDKIPISALQPTPDHVPYDVQCQHPPPESPDTTFVSKRRNKSMYVLRNGNPTRTADWAPRTVRFSSSGSGEYAIPFGSLVP